MIFMYPAYKIWGDFEYICDEKENARMNWKKKFDRVPGLVITVLLLVVSVIFMVMLARTKMIPDTYMIVAGVILLLFVVLTAALVWRMSNKIRFTVGALLGFVFIAILAIGGAYVNQTRTAITLSLIHI